MGPIKIKFISKEAAEKFKKLFLSNGVWTVPNLNYLLNTYDGGILNISGSISTPLDEYVWGWETKELCDPDILQEATTQRVVGVPESIYYITLPEPKRICKKVNPKDLKDTLSSGVEELNQNIRDVQKYMDSFNYALELQKEVQGIDDGGERISYGENGAVREPSTGKGRFDLISPFGLQRIARWYELGSMKYAERNWEKGIPFSRCMDSAMRHLNKYMMGMTDEDHLAAAAWNVIGIMHYEQVGRKDLDDLPHYVGSQWVERDTNISKEILKNEYMKNREILQEQNPPSKKLCEKLDEQSNEFRGEIAKMAVSRLSEKEIQTPTYAHLLDGEERRKDEPKSFA